MNIDFNESIRQIVNLKCWACIAGEGTGSIFTMNFGKKIPYEIPIENPHLSKDERENKSEYSIMVYSSWTLTKYNDIVCDSESSNKDNGPMILGLRMLVGNKVLNCKIDDSYNLLLEFENQFALSIITDGFEMYGDDSENYIVFFPEFSYTIKDDLSITKEIREYT